MLMPTSPTTAACQGRMTTSRTSNSEYTMALAGMQASAVSPMPMTLTEAYDDVSALNTRLMSRLLWRWSAGCRSFLRSTSLDIGDRPRLQMELTTNEMYRNCTSTLPIMF